ncbi:hypothetical protein MLD38_037248 [Melastoma candidum]|uniref:Uncharacterized protein n=1 Tax=Melastoma candidum TaxID=119954 RepID=A0ACB9LMY4_9MYRT|nr:hypothetical protein MLD38_037248 [Melastoma candidum]
MDKENRGTGEQEEGPSFQSLYYSPERYEFLPYGHWSRERTDRLAGGGVEGILREVEDPRSEGFATDWGNCFCTPGNQRRITLGSYRRVASVRRKC